MDNFSEVWAYEKESIILFLSSPLFIFPKISREINRTWLKNKSVPLITRLYLGRGENPGKVSSSSSLDFFFLGWGMFFIYLYSLPPPAFPSTTTRPPLPMATHSLLSALSSDQFEWKNKNEINKWKKWKGMMRGRSFAVARFGEINFLEETWNVSFLAW